MNNPEPLIDDDLSITRPATVSDNEMAGQAAQANRLMAVVQARS